MPTALCVPNAPWSHATLAGLLPVETRFRARSVPVLHRPPGTYTVTRAAYPEGAVLLPEMNGPTGAPAVLPAFFTQDEWQAVTLDPDDLLDCARGACVVFL